MDHGYLLKLWQESPEISLTNSTLVNFIGSTPDYYCLQIKTTPVQDC